MDYLFLTNGQTKYTHTMRLNLKNLEQTLRKFSIPTRLFVEYNGSWLLTVKAVSAVCIISRMTQASTMTYTNKTVRSLSDLKINYLSSPLMRVT